MKSVTQGIKKLYTAGFMHIFSTSIVNKLFSLLTNMLIVRLLNKTDYGNYSYAYNVISIILIVSDLGTRTARLQYCCETTNLEERKAITKYLLRVGTISNVLFTIVTFVYASFVPLSIPGARLPLQLLSLFTVFQFFTDQTSNSYRIEKDNRHYAYLTNILTVGYMLFGCFGAYLFGSTGFILGRYIAFGVPIVIGGIWAKKYLYNAQGSYTLPVSKKVEIVKYGLLIMITNAVSSVLHHFDTLLVGEIIQDELVLADYKVATIIPNALLFIPGIVITFVYPHFVEHKMDWSWIRKNTKKMQLYLSVPIAVITIVSVIFAPLIFKAFWGEQYISAVPIFRVLMTSFFVSCVFRSIYGNVLSMMHLVKVNFVLSTVECVVNIFADVVLINKYGSIGAAFATVAITFFSAVISGAYFYYKARRKV